MQHGKYRFVISFLALPVLLYVVFVISPYAQAFYISMTNWQGFSTQLQFVGFDNYIRLFQDDIFWKAIRNNLFLLIALPIITIALGLFFATMLNLGGRKGKVAIEGVRGSAFYKIVYFFPYVLSVAVIAVLWQAIYNPTDSGLLNGFLKLIGLESLQQPWLANPNTALWAVLGVLVWTSVGFYVVLFTASMSNVPRELYEAALLDGASRWQTFTKITIPLIWDSMQVAIVYIGIQALDAFAVVQIMTVGPGGPDNSTQVVAHYLYESAFKFNSQFGYASAMGVVLCLLTLLMAALTFRVSRRERLEF